MSYLIPQTNGRQEAALKTLRQLEAENASMRAAIALAYGYLWHANSEPGTPEQYPAEKAANEARLALRDLMTHQERGEAIGRVRELLHCSDAPKTPKYGNRPRLRKPGESVEEYRAAMGWSTKPHNADVTGLAPKKGV